mgnify:CR=1 FL=1
MKSSNTVDGVGANDRKISHSNFLWISFFNKTHSLDLLIVSWIVSLQKLNKIVVNQINEFKMSWQKRSDKIDGPFLKSFWKNGMISIRESFVDNFPCNIVFETFFINQNSKKLDGSNSWMSIVQLDFIFRREFREIVSVILFVSSKNIIKTCRTEEILLLKSKFFSSVGRIIWI